MHLFDRIPWPVALVAALSLGLAPFLPELHIVEKLRMLANGSLSRPIDIFDLGLHGAPWLMLIGKAVRVAFPRRQ